MIERNQVYNCDCMAGMAQMPDNHIDLAIVDPPYGIGAGDMNLGFSNTSRIQKSNWDSAVPRDEYFAELFRVSRQQVIWGGNYFRLPPSRCFVVWDKMEGMYNRSFAECEQAWCSFDRSAKLYRLSPNNLPEKKIHKCQKPVDLYKWILHNYAEEGDLILDTHVGSGSSIIACIDKGFDYIGYEIDADYYKAMQERIYHFTRQTALPL